MHFFGGFKRHSCGMSRGDSSEGKSDIKINALAINRKQKYIQYFATETSIGTPIVQKYDIDAICTLSGFYWIGLLK